jgi:uncharacterized cupredoxin-like copper-binding protein
LTDIRATALCALLSLSVISACSKPAEQPAAARPAGGGQPAQAATVASAQTVTGPVLETMNASSYTYVRVKTDTGDVWAAAGEFKVAVGDRVTLALEMPMENFHSETLKRDFPLIYFTTRIAREGEPLPAAAGPAMMSAHGGSDSPGAGAPAAQVTEPIQPPPGGTTVAKVWADRKALAGKTVTVRGKVVKFNGGIMGRNWIHIQDGTGAAADGTNDLLVTSDAAAKIGDVITVSGTVAIDQDFTAGYAYAVLIENAKIESK